MTIIALLLLLIVFLLAPRLMWALVQLTVGFVGILLFGMFLIAIA